MTEFEIKLEVPPARAGAVRAAMARLGAKRDRLRATYYDTPERLLQRERFALRTRLEGGSWMQALKGEGSQANERLEDNVRIAASRGAPRPLARHHAKSPAGGRLLRVLGAGFDDSLWEPLFETDVERMTATVEAGGTEVEIAFDRGRIVAGARATPVCEVEFELKAGDAAAAVEVARTWRSTFGLSISTISKAEKGMRLCKGHARSQAAGARDVVFPKHASLARITGAALACGLDHAIANASELAAGSSAEEQVHQARVGIRRVRTALRELAGEEGSPEELALVLAFRELGVRRDAHHVMAGASPRPVHRAPVPQDIVRAPAFQDALLSLLARACRLRADKGPPRGAKADIDGRLDRLLAQSLRDGRRFESLDPLRQHRVRKRLKRLRYLAEFTAPVHDGKQLTKYLRKLKNAQDALGRYNDDVTALAGLRGDPLGNWFEIAWLEAECAAGAHECERRMRKLARARPFWH